jgi:hypothetical protein
LRKSGTVTRALGGRRLTGRAGLAGLVMALSMAFVALINPAAASAESCDGTYLIAGQSGSNGNPIFSNVHTHNYPNPSGEFSMPTTGSLRYVAAAGTIRPNGFAVFSFFKDLPSGPVLVAQVRKTAGSNGVIRQEPAAFDTGTFAHPGDRLRLQGFWETNGFCTPGRQLDSTLGFVNFV